MILDESDSTINNLPKLQWACRRGMLELDILLGQYLVEAYPTASLLEKKQFVSLLNCADPELFAWLMGHEQPDDYDLNNIVSVLRAHVAARV